MVALQGAKHVGRALGLRRVAPQCTQQHRQRRRYRALRLRGVGAQLVGNLLQRRALQLRQQFFGERGGCVHGVLSEGNAGR